MTSPSQLRSGATTEALEAANYGDADLASVGRLLADRGRCRMLLALGDGRALPASRLAAEANVSPATASSHLAQLVAGGLIQVEPYGRYRYYRLAGPEVGRLIEALARVSPAEPVRSLRQGTRSQALRAARTCYDHLAGRLGVEVMSALIDRGALTGGDGRFDPARDGQDRPSAYGREVEYRLTEPGLASLSDLGVDVPLRPRAIRYCIDWTEQRHHLSGALGSALLARFVELRWVRRSEGSRAVLVAPEGREGLAQHFAISWPPR